MIFRRKFNFLLHHQIALWRIRKVLKLPEETTGKPKCQKVCPNLEHLNRFLQGFKT